MLKDPEENQENEEGESVQKRIMLLVAAGIILVFAGALLIFVSAAIGGAGGSVSGGIVIFIGPIPIVFGAGPDAGVLILAGAIIAAVCLVLVLLWRRRLVTTGDLGPSGTCRNSAI